MTELTKILDICRGFYEHTVTSGESNMEPTNQILETFLEDNSFVNPMKSNTCLKLKPGSCIDLILTKMAKRFPNWKVMGTGISDPHALILMSPGQLQYRNYKKFEVHSFLQNVEELPEKN